MQVNINNIVSITDANKNFSKVAKMVEDAGSAVVLKNNAPKFVIIDYNKFKDMQIDTGDDLDRIAMRIMENNAEAFAELAK